MNENNNLKTPIYTRNAVKKYYEHNSQIISNKKKNKYHSMTPEQKAVFLANIKRKRQDKKTQELSLITILEENQNKQPSRYSLMTPEAKDTYKAKQRAYYQARKEKLQQPIIDDKDTNKNNNLESQKIIP